MKSPERLVTIVIKRIKKTLYVNAIWRYYEKRFGLYAFKIDNTFGIGLLLFEICIYNWGKEV